MLLRQRGTLDLFAARLDERAFSHAVETARASRKNSVDVTTIQCLAAEVRSRDRLASSDYDAGTNRSGLLEAHTGD